MKSFPLTLAVLAVALFPAIAVAGPKGCPPGLAKKSPACVPPGLAKKGIDRDRDWERESGYRIGDRLRGDYIIVHEPGRHGLDPYGTYYRQNGQIYRVDRETREILDLIGAIGAVLN